MACSNHVNPLRNCNDCLNDLVDDQQKIIYNLHERLDYIDKWFPSIKPTLLRLERQFPPTGPIPEKIR